MKEYGRKLPVKFIVADDESNPVKTGTLTENLIVHDKIQFFVKGSSPPEMAAPSAIVCDRYKVLNIASGCPFEPWMAMRESTDTHWPYTWVIGFAVATPASKGDFRYGKSGYTILDVWRGPLDEFGGQTNKKVGVYASDDPDGVGWYSLFPKALKEWGYDVVGTEKNLGLFPLGTNDFSSIIQEWKNNDVEILWGNCLPPDFGTMWRQCHTLGFKPKMVFAAKAGLYYTDVIAWGGDLPNGIGLEANWLPVYKDSLSIGNTTPQSLLERWTEETGQPLNPAIGWSYVDPQILFNAIERAGSLDVDKVNEAIGKTDMMTITHRVKFDKEMQYSLLPLAFTQWQKTDKPQEWENRVVFSSLDFIPVQAEFLFPIP